jgi:hypothetical protein
MAQANNKVSLNLVIGKIKDNLNKERKQFNLSQKCISQLNYLYDTPERTNFMSYSGIVERAVDTYYTLYKWVETIEKVELKDAK